MSRNTHAVAGPQLNIAALFQPCLLLMAGEDLEVLIAELRAAVLWMLRARTLDAESIGHFLNSTSAATATGRTKLQGTSAGDINLQALVKHYIPSGVNKRTASEQSRTGPRGLSGAS